MSDPILGAYAPIDIQDILPFALRDYLRGNPALNVFVQGRVHLDNDYADQLPYVIITLANGGDVNDSPRRYAEVDYKIEAYSLDRLEASRVSGAVNKALNRQRIPLPQGWINYWTRSYNWTEKLLTHNSQKVYVIGRLYEIRANDSTLYEIRGL